MNCDGVYLFPQSEIPAYQELVQDKQKFWQDVGFGHPSFLQPKDPPKDLAQRRNIYFFTQALSPSSQRGRLHMLRAMAAIARANPDHTVWIKLRHLPEENQDHLHKEQFDYPGLMAELPDVPENLKLTACTMDEALADMCLGITCTSTAAIDVIREGLPCMVHLDYVDNYVDTLVPPMAKVFDQSGVVVGLEDMLHLRAPTPNPAWVEDVFCPRTLGQNVLDTIARYDQRCFQTRPLIEEEPQQGPMGI